MVLRGKLAIWLLVLTCGAGFGQQPSARKDEPHLSKRTEPVYLLQLSQSQITVESGGARACIIVYTDMSFHLEKSRQAMNDRLRTVFVSEGRLTLPEQIQVNNIIMAPEMEKLNDSAVGRERFSFKKELSTIFATIPRNSYRTQRIAGASADGAPFAPGLKTLNDFISAVTSRDLPLTKGAPANNCRAPKASMPISDLVISQPGQPFLPRQLF